MFKAFCRCCCFVSLFLVFCLFVVVVVVVVFACLLVWLVSLFLSLFRGGFFVLFFKFVLRSLLVCAR